MWNKGKIIFTGLLRKLFFFPKETGTVKGKTYTIKSRGKTRLAHLSFNLQCGFREENILSILL